MTRRAPLVAMLAAMLAALVPGAASAGSVAPITVRKWATASSRSSAIGSTGPEVMKATRSA